MVNQGKSTGFLVMKGSRKQTHTTLKGPITAPDLFLYHLLGVNTQSISTNKSNLHKSKVTVTK